MPVRAAERRRPGRLLQAELDTSWLRAAAMDDSDAGGSDGKIPRWPTSWRLTFSLGRSSTRLSEVASDYMLRFAAWYLLKPALWASSKWAAASPATFHLYRAHTAKTWVKTAPHWPWLRKSAEPHLLRYSEPSKREDHVGKLLPETRVLSSNPMRRWCSASFGIRPRCLTSSPNL